jgi:excisionase family DNA binding protein
MDKTYTTEQLSEHLNTPVLTLTQWRQKKKGPVWFRPGKRVLYSEEAVAAWVKAQEAPQVAERETA